jgi:hypothetical protein
LAVVSHIAIFSDYTSLVGTNTVANGNYHNAATKTSAVGAMMAGFALLGAGYVLA